MSPAILGTLGGICFALAAAPSAVRVARVGKNEIVPRSLAWAVLTGLSFTVSYIFLALRFDLLLAISFGTEIACYCVILWYTYFPRDTTPRWPRSFRRVCAVCPAMPVYAIGVGEDVTMYVCDDHFHQVATVVARRCGGYRSWKL